MHPIILSLPHYSFSIPEELKENVLLSEEELFPYSDLYTDRIYKIPDAYTVKSEGVSRVLLDVNRAPDDISKEYEGGKDGVMVHKTWNGEQIYKIEPTEKQFESLIKKYHDPFHAEIDAYMADARFLIDCHSYTPVGPPGKPDEGKPRKDINLGNVNWTSCTREHTVFFRDFFERHGYSVSINDPYSGRYILGRHCHRKRIPHFLVPGIQIEVNHGLYTEEGTLKAKESEIAEINGLMKKLVEEVVSKLIPS
ncbi:N-formylglutamate amidohydrolase [Candidatus Peribacteria bacterium]|nr:N-formylglutamate amidohydrolase [Candidatus Peribacteria bacterium]MBT4021656.1 N-formylglutamate amidohydrolase [Candidatus Peribacteria bacterium]MBT4240820.1 N-formylglutamate amidohydrolase [Candidatus Peribacteria bacterium]MBT4474151.1 N-formylglutamate amidohydrolase [Candidatus Peribacteria bacterium]